MRKSLTPELERLRRALAEGEASGPPVVFDFDAPMDELDQEAEEAIAFGVLSNAVECYNLLMSINLSATRRFHLIAG